MSQNGPEDEIEDVLSSVRRLVSQSEAVARDRSRLVLTAAQRVDGDGDVSDAMNPAPVGGAGPLVLSDSLLDDARSDAAPAPHPGAEVEDTLLRDRIAELDHVVSEQLAQLQGTARQDSDADPDREMAYERDEDRPAGPALPVAPTASDGTDPPPVDEEAIRALVASALRDELRGPLGERITATIRKLVRQEVHRILASEPRA